MPATNTAYAPARFDRSQQRTRALFKGLRGGLQCAVELRGRAFEGLAHGALLLHRLGACALPFSGQRAGHAFHGAAPALQALLVGMHLRRVRFQCLP